MSNARDYTPYLALCVLLELVPINRSATTLSLRVEYYTGLVTSVSISRLATYAR